MKIKLTRARVRDMKPTKSDIMVWDAVIPHFALRVRPNGTKRYMHVYTDPQTNKQKRVTIGDPQLITIDNARSIAARINDGVKADKVNIAEQKPLFADYANDVWMPRREKFIKPGSHARNRLALDKQLLPAFGHLRLDEITKPVILKWFNRYSREYPGGANRTLETLRAILSHAVKVRLIKTDPSHGITKNHKRRMNRFLSDEERTLLLKALDGVTEDKRYFADAIRLLLLTGCRAGEITGLRWSEVGEDKLHLEDSKTGARTVWLSDDAIDLLESLRGRRTGRSPYVFPIPGGKKTRDWYWRLLEFWKKLRKELGMSDVRLHDLRHSFATQAVRRGVDIPVVSKLLGHRRIEMTMRYTHASNADAETAAERIGNKIKALLERETDFV